MPVGMFYLLAYMVTRWREQGGIEYNYPAIIVIFYCIAVLVIGR